MFELEKYREVTFMTLESGATFEQKLTCGSENDIKKLAKFSPKHMKVSKLGLSLSLFIQSRKCMSLKSTGELCVITMKNDAKVEEEWTCQFKIGMRNLTNLDLNTRKSQKVAL